MLNEDQVKMNIVILIIQFGKIHPLSTDFIKIQMSFIL